MRWVEYLKETGCRQTKENYRKWIEKEGINTSLKCGIGKENVDTSFGKIRNDLEMSLNRIRFYRKYIDTDSFRDKMIQMEERKIMECKRRLNEFYGKMV